MNWTVPRHNLVPSAALSRVTARRMAQDTVADGTIEEAITTGVTASNILNTVMVATPTCMRIHGNCCPGTFAFRISQDMAAITKIMKPPNRTMGRFNPQAKSRNNSNRKVKVIDPSTFTHPTIRLQARPLRQHRHATNPS